MNFKIIKQLNEDHENSMTSEEMTTYLGVLYKKCNKSCKEKFNEYLEEKCGVDEVDLAECCKKLESDKGKCDEVIHHLEELSSKLDENSLMAIMEKWVTDGTDFGHRVDSKYVDQLKKAHYLTYTTFLGLKNSAVNDVPQEIKSRLLAASKELESIIEKLGF